MGIKAIWIFGVYLCEAANETPFQNASGKHNCDSLLIDEVPVMAAVLHPAYHMCDTYTGIIFIKAQKGV